MESVETQLRYCSNKLFLLEISYSYFIDNVSSKSKEDFINLSISSFNEIKEIQNEINSLLDNI